MLIRPHDLSKVAFICNSALPVSRQAAEWYAARRGISPVRIFEYNMGTAAYGFNPYAAGANLTFMQNVIDTCYAQGVEVLLSSIAVPTHVSGSITGADYFFRGTTNILGTGLREVRRPDARYNPTVYYSRVIESPNNQVSPDLLFVHPMWTKGKMGVNFQTLYSLPPTEEWTPYIYCGRLGKPRFRTGESLTAETLEGFQQLVEDSLHAETIPAREKRILIDVSTRSGVFGGDLVYFLRGSGSLGLNIQWRRKDDITGLNSFGTRADLLALQTSGEMQLWWPQVNNGVWPVEEFDLWVGTSMENPWPGGFEPVTPLAYTNCFSPRRGATVYCNTSFGYQVGSDMQLKGAANWLGCYTEPFSGNQPDNTAVALGLLSGASLLQAQAWEDSAGVATGDPLHVPFPEFRNRFPLNIFDMR